MANLREGSAIRAPCTRMGAAAPSWNIGSCMEPGTPGRAGAPLGPTLIPGDLMQVVKCCASFSKDPRVAHEHAESAGVGAQISCWAWVGSYRCLSGDALRHRHAEPGHPVEHRAGDPGLGLLAGQSSGAEATTDDGLVSEHGGFPERAPAVADRLLPAQAALV